MTQADRKLRRTEARKIKRSLTKKERRGLSKGLNNIKFRSAEQVEDNKTLFDLISLFPLNLPEEKIEQYINDGLFAVVGTSEKMEEDDLVRNGTIFYPTLGFQLSYLIKYQGPTVSVFILGTDDNKYLAVAKFMKFIDETDVLRMVGYYVGRELVAFMNDIEGLDGQQIEVPEVETKEVVGVKWAKN